MSPITVLDWIPSILPIFTPRVLILGYCLPSLAANNSDDYTTSPKKELCFLAKQGLCFLAKQDTRMEVRLPIRECG